MVRFLLLILSTFSLSSVEALHRGVTSKKEWNPRPRQLMGMGMGMDKFCKAGEDPNFQIIDGNDDFCGKNIETSNSLIVLHEDVECPRRGLWINANHVTLDCKGNKITGTGIGNGIRVRNVDNVVLLNCHISNFRRGVRIRDSTNVLVQGFSSSYNTRHGLDIAGTSSDLTLVNSHFDKNGRNGVDVAKKTGSTAGSTENLFLAHLSADGNGRAGYRFRNFMTGVAVGLEASKNKDGVRVRDGNMELLITDSTFCKNDRDDVRGSQNDFEHLSITCDNTQGKQNGDICNCEC